MDFAEPRSDPWDRTLYVLADRLHTPVYELRRNMPVKELVGWIRHLGDKNTSEKPIDVTTMKPEQLKELFG